MRKLLIAYFVVILIAFSSLALPARAAEMVEKLTSYIVIMDDGSAVMEETIVYNFGDLEKHGIYRDLPVAYTVDGKRVSVDLLDITVTNPVTEEPWKHTSWREGNFKRIRIGDPNVFVTGTQYYTIKYIINGVINSFPARDEFYWNAVGTGWEVPVQKAEATVIFSEKLGAVPLGAVSTTCFAGANDDTTGCTTTSIIPDKTNPSAAKRVVFSQDNLGPHEGLTIAVALPKGHITIVPTAPSAPLIWKKVFINPIWLAPLITIAALYWLWRRYGQDPKGRGAIVAEYDAPKDFSPSQVAGIWNSAITTDDISADIIYLATRKYIKIVYDGNDYILQKLKDFEDAPDSTLSKLMAALFTEKNNKEYQVNNKKITGVKLSDLKSDTRLALDIHASQTMRRLVWDGYFTSDPKKKRGQLSGYAWMIVLNTLLGWFVLSDDAILRYGSAAIIIVLVFTGVIKTIKRVRSSVKRFHPLFLAPLSYLVAWAQNYVPLLGTLSWWITAVIIYRAGRYMSIKTQKGAVAYDHIAGLELYIRVAEQERIKFHNAPEKKPELFEKLLPFAMVLGLEEKWEKEFAEIYHEPPEWFETTESFRRGFDLKNIKGMNTAVSSSIRYIPAISKFSFSSRSGSSAWSGGSGFSGGSVGGGRGGGGGGSW